MFQSQDTLKYNYSQICVTGTVHVLTNWSVLTTAWGMVNHCATQQQTLALGTFSATEFLLLLNCDITMQSPLHSYVHTCTYTTSTAAELIAHVPTVYLSAAVFRDEMITEGVQCNNVQHNGISLQGELTLDMYKEKGCKLIWCSTCCRFWQKNNI